MRREGRHLYFGSQMREFEGRCVSRRQTEGRLIDGGGKLWRGQHIDSAEVGTLGRGGKSSGEGGTDGDVALFGGGGTFRVAGFCEGRHIGPRS